MPIVILLLGTAILQVIGKIDVAWSVQIVTSDERRGQVSEAGVRDVVPRGAAEQQRMEADAVVRRGDTVTRAVPPGSDDALDRARVDARPVAEHDDRCLDLIA
jgi:hypothetical protein